VVRSRIGDSVADDGRAVGARRTGGAANADCAWLVGDVQGVITGDAGYTSRTMGEFDVLHHIYASNDALGADVLVPPGDDMAVVRWNAQSLLVAVDQCVDGVHVDCSTMSLAQIGRKAVARSLSDIAAMAARPTATLAAATLPRSMTDADACELADAMRDTASLFNAPLIGGDLARHTDDSPLVCGTTVLGTPGPAGARTRSAARIGDDVYVTGHLGGSLDPDGGGHHLSFAPRLDVALWLARQIGERLHAMIDISDGLGRDAGHIAAASGMHIELDARAIPRRHACSLRSVFTDGEDYELCFTALGDVPSMSPDGVRVTRIGRVIGAADDGRVPLVEVVGLDADDARSLGVESDAGAVRVHDLGWDHRSG